MGASKGHHFKSVARSVFKTIQYLIGVQIFFSEILVRRLFAAQVHPGGELLDLPKRGWGLKPL